MGKRAVLYARVSGDDRGNDGRNLEGQIEMGREHARKRGYVVVAELPEDARGASGAEINLPQLDRIRQMASARDFDVLVVREIDRLSRNLAKQLIVEEELRRAGVEIDYVIGEYPDTPEGRFLKNVRATVAEFEREKISERMTRGRRLRAKAGSIVAHGRAPYGYRLAESDGKMKLVVNEAEAQVVRLIFTWYTVGDGRNGPVSICRIADRLSADGIPSRADDDPKIAKRQVYGHWNRTSIRNILLRETYTGTWHYGKVRQNGTRRQYNAREAWIPVQVPAIIPHEVWEAAQARMARNKTDSPRNMKHGYLLRRRLKCASCGAKMAASTSQRSKGGYAYYSCPSHIRQRNYARECDMRAYFRADLVDAAVWEWLEAFLRDPKTLLDGLRAQQAQLEENVRPYRERLSVVDQVLAENRQQLERILDLYLVGSFPQDLLIERKNRLEKTIADLEQEQLDLRKVLVAGTLTDEQVASVTGFARKIATALDTTRENPEAREQIVETVHLRGKLAVENGEQVVHAECLLGEGVIRVSPTTTGRCCEGSSCRCPRAGGRPCGRDG